MAHADTGTLQDKWRQPGSLPSCTKAGKGSAYSQIAGHHPDSTQAFPTGVPKIGQALTVQDVPRGKYPTFHPPLLEPLTILLRLLSVGGPPNLRN